MTRSGGGVVEEFIFEAESCSDGYHSFDELYSHRIALFIKLCDLIAFTEFTYRAMGKQLDDRSVWRSKLHSDGSAFDGWFILGIKKEAGKQVTYHIPLSHWDDTEFAETLDRAYAWDGHTSEDVLERIKRL